MTKTQNDHSRNRRQSPRFVLRLISTAAALAVTLGLGVTGCKKADAGGAAGGSGDKPITIGFIYVGTKDDYGYNQAHAEGAAAVKAMPGVKVIENEKIKEDIGCQQAMEGMINLSGATLIFPTSFGYFDPHVIEVGKKNPKTTFLHAGGLRNDVPSNVGSYFAYIDEAEYLCGMAAGMATKSNKLGYIAAKPITPVLRDINAFELGAKAVNSKATTTVIFTGDWFLPVAEADAVKNLADQGIDVVTGHIDSPKVLIETADKRGIFSCGYHFNGSKLSPTKYLTGAEWNWGPMYVQFVKDYQSGKLQGDMPHSKMGSFKTGAVQLSPYGPGVSDEAKKKIDEAKAKFMAGTLKIYIGPIKDNKGAEKIPAGKAYDDEDGALWGIVNFFVEGVIGSTGG